MGLMQLTYFSLSKQHYSYYKANKQRIAKRILDIYLVEYDDPNSLIYKFPEETQLTDDYCELINLYKELYMNTSARTITTRSSWNIERVVAND